MSELKLFGGRGKPDCRIGWDMYEKGLAFNRSIDLEDCVRTNENFYVGKQWEGVESNGLPTPQFNILKRVVGFTVANINAESIKVTATPLANVAGKGDDLNQIVQIVNDEFQAITERNDVMALVREFSRNAAVDGDGCIYTYWDADAETGQPAKGAIVSEIVENTRVHFGNPQDRRVQSQPWIIISAREMVREVRIRAKANGMPNWESIVDDRDIDSVDESKKYGDDDKVTVCYLFWRDDDDGQIWCYEFTQNSGVKAPWNLGITLYPIVWINWDYVQDCFHGQAMLTGLIPNQIFINKAWAMAMLSIMRSAYGKVIYDKTRVAKWDNRVGSAIGINGGDVNSVAKIVDPAPISPQISQFIQLAVSQTESSLGATAVALGDTRPDNTSAIIALQRAASTPNELTKRNLYRATEDLYRIYLEFIAEYYGTRFVDVPTPQRIQDAMRFAQMEAPEMVPVEFDFRLLKNHPMTLKLDAGGSSYYSQIASQQTLDNLLMNGHINIVQYLERTPDDYVPARASLIAELKRKQREMDREHELIMQQQGVMIGAPGPEAEGGEPEGEEGPEPEEQTGGNLETAKNNQKEAMPTNTGYGNLQRKINETGDVRAVM